MQVVIHSVNAIAGMVVPMTTPGFFVTATHCLTFDYEVRSTGDAPILEVHIRTTDYMLTGRRIWTSQDSGLQHNRARIALSAENGPRDLKHVFDFVGIVSDPTSTLIRIANIDFLDGQCEHEEIVIATNMELGTVVTL